MIKIKIKITIKIKLTNPTPNCKPLLLVLKCIQYMLPDSKQLL